MRLIFVAHRISGRPEVKANSGIWALTKTLIFLALRSSFFEPGSYIGSRRLIVLLGDF